MDSTVHPVLPESAFFHTSSSPPYICRRICAFRRLPENFFAGNNCPPEGHCIGTYWCEVELYRLYGELSLRAGERAKEKESSSHPLAPSSPEECFLKAIAIARQQQAKSWELRASISRARLWQQQGKKVENRNMLSSACHWFTEGFETKDLQEARALLEELNH